MKQLMQPLLPFFSGLLFGLGLVVSGMTNPSKVHNLKEILTPFGNCAPENAGDWFKFVGDGNVWTFFMTADKYSLGSFQAYIGSGSCDSLVCVKAFDIRNGWLSPENRNSFSFKTTLGEPYYLKLASYENAPFDLDLSVLCTPVSTNVDCSAKFNMNCGDEWEGIINLSLVQVSDNPCNDFNSGHYYQITGTGEYFIMTLDKYSGTKALQVSIIENSCENGRCLYQGMMDNQMSKTLLFEPKNNRTRKTSSIVQTIGRRGGLGP